MNWLAVFLSFCDAPSCRLWYSRTPLTLTLTPKANKKMIRVSGGSSQLIVNHKKTGSSEIGCCSVGEGVVRVSGGSTVCPYGLVKKSVCFYLILLGRKKPDRCPSWSHWHYHKINWKRYSKLKMRHEVGRFSDQIHKIFSRMCVTDYVSLEISPVLFVICNHRRL